MKFGERSAGQEAGAPESIWRSRDYGGRSMSRRDWRALLHFLAMAGWVAGLIADVEEQRWGCFTAAVGLHFLAEGLAGNFGLDLA